MSTSDKKIRYAVVSQGWFAQEAILPAFANATENSELAAIVSGDAEKRRELSELYDVPAYPYEEYEGLLRSGKIDAVYIASVNAEHRPMTEAAAKAGIHVLCEKPIAHTVADAEAMVRACRDAGVKLMIAYRLHFEEANLSAIELIESGKIGEPRMFNSTFTLPVQQGNSRLQEDRGGGPVEDIGIYCINAMRYLFRDEPTEVMAMAASGNDPRFREVPEMVSAVLRFPGERMGTFTCGFGEAKVDSYRIVGTKGDLRIDNGYGFTGDKVHHLTIDGSTEETTYSTRDHLGPEIVYFSECVLTGHEPEPNGVEGLIDMKIIDAIYRSAKERRAVEVGPFEPKPRPTMEQHIYKPAIDPPELVNAAPPPEPQPRP